MIDTLEQLSNAVGVITKADARQAADAVNRRMLDLVGADVIKLYWSEEAEDGGTILAPFAYINDMQFDDPKPFQVPKVANGVLSWVFLTGLPLWLEDLQDRDITLPARNKATGDAVPPESLDIRPPSSIGSMMCIPLVVRGKVHGIYSVELQATGRLRPPILGLLQRLGRSLASLLWNADVYEFDQHKTSRAVQQFLFAIRSYAFDPIFLEERYKSSFLARPFEADFTEFETRVSEVLKRKKVRARCYRPTGGREYVVEDIQKEIRNSHFCIADISGTNPNVMTEVGMMMVLGKHFLLLRKRGDPGLPPFDIRHLPIYEYEMNDGEGLRVWSPGGNSYQPFGQVVDDFIRHLPVDSGFSTASDWTG